jgi:sec-independent protein translocase protein TatB
MFDIGFFEIILVSIVATVVISPEQLPAAVRSTLKWIRKTKNTFVGIKQQVAVEFGTEEIKREIHNASLVSFLDQNESSTNVVEKKSANKTRK